MRILNSFGLKLKMRRQERGLDQKQLARAIGATQPMVSRWENDKIFPSEPYQEKLKEILDVDQSFFEGAWDALPLSYDDKFDLMKERLEALEIELQALKSRPGEVIPLVLKQAWLDKETTADQQAACLWILTRDQRYSKSLNRETRLALQALARALGI